MRNLTKKEKEFYKDLTKYKVRIHNKYYVFSPGTKRYGRKKYKRSRVIMMLHLNKKLEQWEIVHHKDKNKLNDNIKNLGVLNTEEHSNEHNEELKKRKYPNYKPVNTTPLKVQKRIKDIAKTMIKINYSEIARLLKKEGIEITSYTVAKYITKKLTNPPT